ncbi:MAG: hypothetical protein AAGA30_08670, partial [Planctomycetota bacterium]
FFQAKTIKYRPGDCRSSFCSLFEMPFIRLQCPACESRLKIEKKYAYKAIVCPTCNTRFRVDQETSTVVIERSKDLFGLPVSDEVSNGEANSDPFGNIDEIIARSEPPNSDSPKVSGSTQTEPETTPESSLVKKWKEEKKVTTRLDESLQRNGIGLLILSMGMSILPFAADNVEGLRPILPSIPTIVATLGFIATFMIAYSMRRASVLAILGSVLPWLLLCGVATGGYYYHQQQNLAREVQPEFVEPKELVDEEGFDLDLGFDPIDANGPEDRLDFDADSIIDNAASKFVPGEKKDLLPATNQNPSPSTFQPAPTKDFSPNLANAQNTEFRPNQIPHPELKIPDDDAGDGFAELKQISDNVHRKKKLVSLQERKEKLQRGLISMDKVVRPYALSESYKFSKTAGEKTVYGVALYDLNSIQGIDAVAGTSTLEMITPIVDNRKYSSGIVIPENSQLVGLNVNLSEDGIVGLQGLFAGPDGSTLKSAWLGEKAGTGSEIRLDADLPVQGVVVYLRQLVPVGIRLVMGDSIR